MKKTNNFKFKQFEVIQNMAAMKIGTDAVLLGAWANISEATKVLDIGTGTGILSLQVAQKNQNAKITAIEIDREAHEEASINFINSPWKDRLICFNQSLDQFISDNQQTFDFIICNPPYYNNSYLPSDHQRALARHKDSLGYEELLFSCAHLLCIKGQAAFIIPYETEEKFISIASTKGLFPHIILHIKGNATAPIKRSLIQLSNVETILKITELTIEIERHVYTQAYIDIVKGFYLKM